MQVSVTPSQVFVPVSCSDHDGKIGAVGPESAPLNGQICLPATIDVQILSRAEGASQGARIAAPHSKETISIEDCDVTRATQYTYARLENSRMLIGVLRSQCPPKEPCSRHVRCFTACRFVLVASLTREMQLPTSHPFNMRLGDDTSQIQHPY